MSQRAYARHRGVSASTVQKAVGAGRIHTLPNGQIDPEIADAECGRLRFQHRWVICDDLGPGKRTLMKITTVGMYPRHKTRISESLRD